MSSKMYLQEIAKVKQEPDDDHIQPIEIETPDEAISPSGIKQELVPSEDTLSDGQSPGTSTQNKLERVQTTENLKVCSVPEKKHYSYKIIENDSNLLLYVQRDDAASYLCKSCSEKCYLQTFKYHMMEKHNILLYECSICINVKLHLNSIERHIETKHSGSSSFKCIQHMSKQKYSYSLISLEGFRLVLSQADNFELNTFECQICPRKLRNKVFLEEHIRIKHLFRYFKCSSCDLSFSFDDLELHLLMNHYNSKKVSEFECEAPNISKNQKPYFYTFSKGKKLYNLVLTQEERYYQFACEDCEKDFSNNTNLESHIKEMHSNSKFTCKVCNDQVELDSIEEHLGKHSKCTYFVFSTSTMNEEFKRTSVSYTLQENRGFELKLIYKNCLKGSFNCEICLNRFTEENALNEHMQNNHSIRNFMCGICFETRQFKSLDFHSRTHSKESRNSFIFRCLSNVSVLSKIHYFSYNLHSTFTGAFVTVVNKLEAQDSFMCSICNLNISGLLAFFEHIRWKHNFQKFQCSICKDIKKSMIEHLRMFHIVKPEVAYNFKGILKGCSWNLSFHKVNDFLKVPQGEFNNVFCLHLVKSGLSIFNCDVCSTRYPNIGDLEKHLVDAHHVLKKYFCTSCRKIEFFSYEKLSSHKQNELILLTFEENECHNIQGKIADVIAKSPPTTSSNDILTDIINFYSYIVYPNADGRMFYISVKKSQNFDFTCAKCDLSFLSIPPLKHHLLTKHHLKKFRCANCFEDTLIENFALHMTSKHSDEEMSQSSFIAESSIAFEQERCLAIEPTKNFESPFAKYSYTFFLKFNSYRVAVTKAVNGNVLYDCQVCQMKFPVKFLLRIHMTELHSIKKTMCGSCGKDVTFPQFINHCNKFQFDENHSVFYCLNAKSLSISYYENVSMTLTKGRKTPFDLYVYENIGEKNLLKCQCCNLSLTDIHVFRIHVEQFHKSSIIECNVCDVVVDFANIYHHLTHDHKMKKKLVYVFKCSENLEFVEPRKMLEYHCRSFDRSHISIEVVKQSRRQYLYFKCHICPNKELDTEEELRAHVVEKHNAHLTLTCTVCLGLVRFSEFFDHMESAHPSCFSIDFVDKGDYDWKKDIENCCLLPEPSVKEIEIFEGVNIKREPLDENEMNVEYIGVDSNDIMECLRENTSQCKNEISEGSFEQNAMEITVKEETSLQNMEDQITDVTLLGNSKDCRINGRKRTIVTNVEGGSPNKAPVIVKRTKVPGFEDNEGACKKDVSPDLELSRLNRWLNLSETERNALSSKRRSSLFIDNFSYMLISDNVCGFRLGLKNMGRQLYVCKVCTKNFRTKEDLNYHLMNSHDSMSKFICFICQNITDFSQVAQHVSEHSENNLPWHFFNCENSVVATILLKLVGKEDCASIEITERKNKENFECNICKASFKESSAFKVHVESKHKFQKYSCNSCKDEFLKYTQIFDHVHNHHNNIECVLKVRKFSYKLRTANTVMRPCPSLLQHQICITLEPFLEIASQYFCYICAICFRNVAQFNDHFYTNHQSKSDHFSCLKCRMVVDINKFHAHVNLMHAYVRRVEFMSIAGLKVNTKNTASASLSKIMQTTNTEDGNLLTSSQVKVTSPKSLKRNDSTNSVIKVVSLKNVKTSTPSTSKNLEPKYSNISDESVIKTPTTSSNQRGNHLKIIFGSIKDRGFCIFTKFHDKAEYRCSFCPKLNFLIRDTFLEHIEDKHLNLPVAYIVCNSCSDTVSPERFENHMIQEHFQVKLRWVTFKLVAFDQTFETRNENPKFRFTLELDNHSLIRVTSSEEWSYECGYCSVNYEEIGDLSNHVTSKHKSQIARFMCEICGEMFATTESLPTHILLKHRNDSSILFTLHIKRKESGEVVKPKILKLKNFKVIQSPPEKLPKSIEGESIVLTYIIDSKNDHYVSVRLTKCPKFTCTACKIGFKDCFHLEDHIESHHTKIAYCICGKCCTVITSLSEFSEHIRSLHSDEDKTEGFDFKLISSKTSVLKDIERGSKDLALACDEGD